MHDTAKDAEKIGAKLGGTMREALIAARSMLIADRDALIDCHTGPDGLDLVGREAADEYDQVLKLIDAALLIDAAFAPV